MGLTYLLGRPLKRDKAFPQPRDSQQQLNLQCLQCLFLLRGSVFLTNACGWQASAYVAQVSPAWDLSSWMLPCGLQALISQSPQWLNPYVNSYVYYWSGFSVWTMSDIKTYQLPLFLACIFGPEAEYGFQCQMLSLFPSCMPSLGHQSTPVHQSSKSCCWTLCMLLLKTCFSPI